MNIIDFGQFLHNFNSKLRHQIQKHDKLIKKCKRPNLSVIFNKTCLTESCPWMCQCWPTSKDLPESTQCGHRMPPRRPARSNG